MTRRSFPNPAPRGEWLPTVAREPREPAEHKCGRCWGPYGRSAIPCPNDPKQTPQIAAERRPRVTLDELLDNLDPKENS